MHGVKSLTAWAGRKKNKEQGVTCVKRDQTPVQLRLLRGVRSKQRPKTSSWPFYRLSLARVHPGHTISSEYYGRFCIFKSRVEVLRDTGKSLSEKGR